MVMRETPWPLTEVISSMPEMVESCRSSTVATAEAMVSGLAPGSSAVIWIDGKPTLGSVWPCHTHASPPSSVGTTRGSSSANFLGNRPVNASGGSTT